MDGRGRSAFTLTKRTCLRTSGAFAICHRSQSFKKSAPGEQIYCHWMQSHLCPFEEIRAAVTLSLVSAFLCRQTGLGTELRVKPGTKCVCAEKASFQDSGKRGFAQICCLWTQSTQWAWLGPGEDRVTNETTSHLLCIALLHWVNVWIVISGKVKCLIWLLSVMIKCHVRFRKENWFIRWDCRQVRLLLEHETFDNDKTFVSGTRTHLHTRHVGL